MNPKVVRNSRHLKGFNRHSVLQLIRRRAVSRSELAAETGLTRAAISLIIEGLVREGLLQETGRRESLAERKPVLLELHPEYAYAAGLTISRTGASLGLLNLAGELVQRSTLPIEGFSRKMALRQMKRGVSQLLDSSRRLRHVPVFRSPLGLDCELIAAAAIIIEKYFLGEITATPTRAVHPIAPNPRIRN